MATLKEQLAGKTQLDYSAYGNLPIREDVYVIKENKKEDAQEQKLLKQWEKLNYIRKHLKIINKYILSGSEAILNDWLKENKQGISDLVRNKIGGYNNTTGGISAYFLNLQNFYDEQEKIYDAIESDSSPAEDIKRVVFNMRQTRGDKRKNRGVARKITIKNLKADGKGYLFVAMEEAPATSEKVESTIKKAADDAKEAVKDEKNATSENVVVSNKDKEEIKKTGNNIGVWIAGTLIFVASVAAIAAIATPTKDK